MVTTLATTFQTRTRAQTTLAATKTSSATKQLLTAIVAMTAIATETYIFCSKISSTIYWLLLLQLTVVVLISASKDLKNKSCNKKFLRGFFFWCSTIFVFSSFRQFLLFGIGVITCNIRGHYFGFLEKFVKDLVLLF